MEHPEEQETAANAVEASKESPNEEQSSQASPENLSFNIVESQKTISANVENSGSPPLNSLSEIDKESFTISKLQQEIKIKTEERDDYKRKLEETEEKLIALQKSFDNIAKDNNYESQLRSMMEQLKKKLIQTSLQLEDRGRVVANQENQINALNNQVTSLKEVVAITKDLLQIRNMEVKHLQAEVDDMEGKITEERERHTAMMNKMEAAVRLNADLKKEYETQLRLFQDLRGKYEEKVTLLSEEKKVLESTISEAK